MIWTLGGTENEPEEFGVEKEDGGGDDPGDHSRQARVCEFSHFGAAARELDKRDHRERQLKTENHLTKNEQRSDFVLSGISNNQRGRRSEERRVGKECRSRWSPY